MDNKFIRVDEVAQEWERKFQLQNSADFDMDFESFAELYTNDVKNRLKENTCSQRSISFGQRFFRTLGK